MLCAGKFLFFPAASWRMHRNPVEYMLFADKSNLCPAALWQMHRRQSENMHCASKASLLAVSWLTHCKQLEYMHYAGVISFFTATSWQMLCKPFKYIYSALARLISSQWFPARCTASNLSSPLVIQAPTPPPRHGGFLADALLAYRNVLYAGKFNLFPAASWQMHCKQMVHALRWRD